MAIFDQKVVIVQFISSDHIWVISSITDHSHLVVERNKANFSIGSSVADVLNLLRNGCLEALHSGHVSDIPLALQELVRSITKLLEIIHFFDFVTFELVLALNWLRDAH
jgi:hypothetical protein